MKKNAQPEKKVEDKDVDEFEKCRDTLKNSTTNSSQVISNNIKASQKMAGALNREKREDSLSEKDLDKTEEIKSTHKDKINEDTDVKTTEELKEGYESPKEDATNEKVSSHMVEEDLNTENTKEDTADENMECGSYSQIASSTDEKITAVDSVDISE